MKVKFDCVLFWINDMMRPGVGKRGWVLGSDVDSCKFWSCKPLSWRRLNIFRGCNPYIAVQQPYSHFAPPRNKKSTFTISGPKGLNEVETNPAFVEMQCCNHRLWLRSASCPKSTNPHHKHSKVCRTNFQTDQKLPGSCRNLFFLSNNPKRLRYLEDQ